MELKKISYRFAAQEDTFPLMELYQKGSPFIYEEPLFLESCKLLESIKSSEFLWIAALEGKDIKGVLAIKLEKEQRLCKIYRAYTVSEYSHNQELFLEMLRFATAYLEKDNLYDLFYNTTYNITLEQQAATTKLGFEVSGIFPIIKDVEAAYINGAASYYFKNVLVDKGQDIFNIHPIVAPLYEVVRKRLKLPVLPIAVNCGKLLKDMEPLPELEIITAPKFVSKRFETLRDRKFLSVNFYPFQEANTLITDPDQNIEIFINLSPEIRFAAIIGERLNVCINPVDLYKKVTSILRKKNISYIEIINDAADVWTIDCIAKAGFIPCVYFPRFMDHGKDRRDYVIFAKQYENYHCLFNNTPEIYLDYLSVYYNLESQTRHLTS